MYLIVVFKIVPLERCFKDGTGWLGAFHVVINMWSCQSEILYFEVGFEVPQWAMIFHRGEWNSTMGDDAISSLPTQPRHPSIRGSTKREWHEVAPHRWVSELQTKILPFTPVEFHFPPYNIICHPGTSHLAMEYNIPPWHAHSLMTTWKHAQLGSWMTCFTILPPQLRDVGWSNSYRRGTYPPSLHVWINIHIYIHTYRHTSSWCCVSVPTYL